MLRQNQEKVLHKLTKLVTKPPPNNEEAKSVFEEHFKNIAQGISVEIFAQVFCKHAVEFVE